MTTDQGRKKLRALELGRKGNLSPSQIAARLNMSHPKRIREWLEAEGIPVYEPKPFTRSSKPDRIRPTGGRKGPAKT